MHGVRFGASLRTSESGGRSARGAPLRGTAAALAAAVLCALTACQTWDAGVPASRVSPFEVQADVDAGRDLYASGEFNMAARRFRSAAAGASALRDRAVQRDAVTAECVSWMRARALDQLSECTQRLERLQGRHVRTDPGVNTLMAMGAIAGRRPLPPFRIPQAVHPIVRTAGKESP